MATPRLTSTYPKGVLCSSALAMHISAAKLGYFTNSLLGRSHSVNLHSFHQFPCAPLRAQDDHRGWGQTSGE
eukprot:6206279-Pleurochrysis_carterae.AAC.6